MIYYKDLPYTVSDFVHNHDVTSIVNSMPYGHAWRWVDTAFFLTDFAKNWFHERGIILKVGAALFKADPHVVNGIHSDSQVNDIGFNFIMSGYGEMQWVDPIGADEVYVDDKGTNYPTYVNASEIKILDVWTGTAALVNIKIPHRISTLSNVPRVCLSLRPDLTKCNINFNSIYDLI